MNTKLNKINDKKIIKKITNKEEKRMKNSYLYGLLSVDWELNKKEKNKLKGIVKKNLKNRKIRRKIKEDIIPYD